MPQLRPDAAKQKELRSGPLATSQKPITQQHHSGLESPVIRKVAKGKGDVASPPCLLQGTELSSLTPSPAPWGWEEALDYNLSLPFLLLPWGLPGGSDGKESACSAGDPSLILGSGRSPGEGNPHFTRISHKRLKFNMSKAELTPSSLYTRLSISVDGPFVHLVTQFFPELCFILHPAVILPFLKCNSHISAYLQLSNGFPLPLGFSPSLLKGLLKPHMTSPRLPLRYHLLPLSHLSIHSVNMY